MLRKTVVAALLAGVALSGCSGDPEYRDRWPSITDSQWDEIVPMVCDDWDALEPEEALQTGRVFGDLAGIGENEGQVLYRVVGSEECVD